MAEQNIIKSRSKYWTVRCKRMWCKNCNLMLSVTGTSYHKKENNNDKGYKRYNECPKCHYKKFNNGLNFQEIMDKAIHKNSKS